MTLAVEEFLRRFLLHLLPRGFVCIRNFAFLANRTALRCCRCASAHFKVRRQHCNRSLREVSLLEQSSCRSVLIAAERCTSSNDLPSLNYSFALRHAQTGVPHEPSSSATDHSHASACPPELCLRADQAPLRTAVFADRNSHPTEFLHRSSRHHDLKPFPTLRSVAPIA